LKYAFEGKLTKEWRESHKDELEPASGLLEQIKVERKKLKGSKQRKLNNEIASPSARNDNLSEVPEGWVWTKLDEISDVILGQSPPSSTDNENGNGLPFYQGKLEFGDIYPVPRKWCNSPQKIAEKGDVLISVRAPVGPTNICPCKSCIGRGLSAIRGLGDIQPFFILYLMRSYEREIAGKGTGTTFKAITGDKLRGFQIPLPSYAEQRKIVEEIERRLSIADEIEKIVAQSLKQSERLRQSILKKAFEGKLVPQDLSEPPASELLERIKAEKEKLEKKKKLKQRRTKRSK